MGIYIVEGIDRVGKTTLCKKLINAGFTYLKDELTIGTDLVNSSVLCTEDYMAGKIDTTIALIKKLQSQGFKNIVVDRLHLTEYVYGLHDRNTTNKFLCEVFDTKLANIGAKLIYVEPSDMILSSTLAGRDQNKLRNLFDSAISSSKISTLNVTYETIDDAVLYILNDAYDYDIYFASPFFNEEQVEREERLIKHLRGLGLKVYSPKENSNLSPDSNDALRQAVFEDNCNAIDNAKIVFAVTDGKDVGTIWEAGYAFGKRKPVVYYAETLKPTQQFNLMLAQSGVGVFRNQEDITLGKILDAFTGTTVNKYKGDIE